MILQVLLANRSNMVTLMTTTTTTAVAARSRPECPICCINKLTEHRTVSCPYCEYKTCHICYRTYILNKTDIITDCMNCHSHIDISSQSALPKTFLNGEWKKHCQKIFAMRTKLSFPLLMEEIIIEDQISQKQKEIKDVYDIYCSIKSQLTDLRRDVNHLMNSKKDKIKIFTIGRRCSWNCNGFLYNENTTNGQCGVCSRLTCLDCNVGIEDVTTHTCKQQDIQSWKLIKETTRPCPKCGTLIHKSQGCNQMWCTQCNTAFDYNTGHIENRTTHIHNPHYYEWLFRDTNNTNENHHNHRCQDNELISAHTLTTVLRLHTARYPMIVELLRNHHRLLIEYQHYHLEKLNTYMTNVDESIKKNAKKFIRNNIAEKLFSMNNANLILKKQTLSGYLDIANTFMSGQINIFNNYFLGGNKLKKIEDFYSMIQMIQFSISIYNDSVERLELEGIKYIPEYIMSSVSFPIMDFDIPSSFSS